MQQKEDIGIVLSGGGAKGYVHIGVLKALEEYHIEPSVISATSMGALIGSLYAAGFSASAILELIESKSWTGFIKLSWNRKSIFTLNKVREELHEILKNNSFESLNKKLFINVSNLSLGKEETYHKGPLIEVVMASCAIPVVFEPITFNQEYQYVDGALYNNFNVLPLTNLCKTIIGSHCNPVFPVKTLASVWDIAERSLNIAVAHNSTNALEYCDWVIEPKELSNYSIWDFNKVTEIAEIGYHYTAQILQKESIESLLNKTKS